MKYELPVRMAQGVQEREDLPITGRLAHGNRKLGRRRGLWSWSIPAIQSCPGRTPLCESICYAAAGHYNHFSTQQRLLANWRFSSSKGFADWMIDTVRQRSCQVVRIHCAGDYYSVAYLRKWHKIIRWCPRTTFYSYTRSWRVQRLRSAVERLAELPNHHLWYSLDRNTGYPEHIPSRVRLCYLLAADGEALPYQVDLVFRDDAHQPGQVIKRVKGCLVCPYEQGLATRIVCASCRICFRESKYKEKHE